MLIGCAIYRLVTTNAVPDLKVGENFFSKRESVTQVGTRENPAPSNFIYYSDCMGATNVHTVGYVPNTCSRHTFVFIFYIVHNYN